MDIFLFSAFLHSSEPKIPACDETPHPVHEPYQPIDERMRQDDVATSRGASEARFIIQGEGLITTPWVK